MVLQEEEEFQVLPLLPLPLPQNRQVVIDLISNKHLSIGLLEYFPKNSRRVARLMIPTSLPELVT